MVNLLRIVHCRVEPPSPARVLGDLAGDPPPTVMSASLISISVCSLSLQFAVCSLKFTVYSLQFYSLQFDVVCVHGGVTVIVIVTAFILVMARGPGRSQGKIAE